MSERPDSAERTEEPTPKKIEDALKKGQAPISREVTTFASLIAILAVLGLWASSQARMLTGQLATWHDFAADVPLATHADVTAVLMAVYRAAGIFMVPIVLLLAAFGIIAAFAQTPPRMVGERVRPKLERISPMAGAKRIFGSHGVAEFLRALFKFAIVGTAAALVLFSEIPSIVRSIFIDPTLLPSHILSVATRLVAVICTAIILLVGADLAWTRFKWRRDLKMTPREVKDELKQAEGDPIVRARIRSAQKDRSRKRMVSRVPEATVVIANPTHYAVALRYVRGEGGAPTVVAKGTDKVALKIREIAEDSDVPVVEDAPLARALYAAVEVDRMIPEEFFRAIAQILHYVYERDGRAAAAGHTATSGARRRA